MQRMQTRSPKLLRNTNLIYQRMQTRSLKLLRNTNLISQRMQTRSFKLLRNRNLISQRMQTRSLKLLRSTNSTPQRMLLVFTRINLLTGLSSSATVNEFSSVFFPRYLATLNLTTLIKPFLSGYVSTILPNDH